MMNTYNYPSTGSGRTGKNIFFYGERSTYFYDALILLNLIYSSFVRPEPVEG